MFTQLLPGLRDLRTPFASGVLWLVFGWLLLSREITAEKYPELFESIESLGAALRPLGVGTSLALAAYLVGTAFEFIWAPLFRLVRPLTFRGRQSIFRLVSKRLDQLPDDELHVLAECHSFTYLNAPRGPRRRWRRHESLYLDKGDRPSRYRNDVTIDLVAAVQDELDLAATRLLTGGKSTTEEGIKGSKELFNVYDRLQAEAEFRIAITAPVCGLLITVLASLASDVFAVLIGILATGTFMFQGAAKKKAAGDRIVDAMIIDVVEAPALADIRPGIYTQEAIDDGRLRVPDRAKSAEEAAHLLLGVPWTKRLWYALLSPFRVVAALVGSIADAVARALLAVAQASRAVSEAVRFVLRDVLVHRGAVSRERRLIRKLPLPDEARAIRLGDLYKNYGFYSDASRAYPDTPDGVERASEAAWEALEVEHAKRNAKALAELMDRLVAEDRAAAAERICRAAIESGLKPAHVLLGDVLQIRGDLTAAEHAYRKAAELGLASGLTRIGDVRVALGDIPGAVEAYRKAADRDAPGAKAKLRDLESQRTGGNTEQIQQAK